MSRFLHNTFGDNGSCFMWGGIIGSLATHFHFISFIDKFLS